MNRENKEYKKYKPSKKFYGPFIIIFIGIVLFLQRIPIDVPEWVFSWNTILIVVGLLLGFKSRFRHWLWFIPVLLGLGSILANHFVPEQYHNLVFPAGLMLFGIYILLYTLLNKNKAGYTSFPRQDDKGFKNKSCERETINEENLIRIENTFGGINRSFLSKDLKGGYIKNIFGGIKVNLMHADFEKTIDIHIENTFGGITIYVPTNWKVVDKLDSHLSGIDDNSYYEDREDGDSKFLVLKGKSVFGGIEIKNF